MFRFFPEGLVLMLTTPEEPLSCLNLLKHKHNRHPAVLVGHYRLHGDCVTLALQRQDPTISRFRSRRNNYNQEQTFHLVCIKPNENFRIKLSFVLNLINKFIMIFFPFVKIEVCRHI